MSCSGIGHSPFCSLSGSPPLLRYEHFLANQCSPPGAHSLPSLIGLDGMPDPAQPKEREMRATQKERSVWADGAAANYAGLGHVCSWPELRGSSGPPVCAKPSTSVLLSSMDFATHSGSGSARRNAPLTVRTRRCAVRSGWVHLNFGPVGSAANSICI